MIRNIIITISAILLLTSKGFADDTISNASKKDTKTDITTQKILDEFYAYAGTIKPEIREEIQKYRVEIVNINKKKRELYDKLSKEAQNFLAKEQEYKQRLSSSSMATEDNKDADKK
ncbi:hypothetical protein BA173_02550 [Rickettsia sp. MEAM1 (Bemisia tabaci)]|uniref:hypothetical protein n=1 Tax=unclassified Rickettsia TaxID=114295 RepID=UPI0002F8BDDE|nr:hypothetical protein BA173_02550 [Rickettsia sp. MEAM1 (Bemisia tabaci)]ODA37666.1 hypothetical protein A8V33_00110 [Rickettsia sp. wb]ODA38455.1 hypothetical protein A8V34_01175 [Rickettsia sp. wq]